MRTLQKLDRYFVGFLLVVFVLLVSLASLKLSQHEFKVSSPVGAEEILSDTQTLTAPGDDYRTEFIVPAGVKIFTIDLYVGAGADDFDLYVNNKPLADSPALLTDWKYAAAHGDWSSESLRFQRTAELNGTDESTWAVAVVATKGSGEFTVVSDSRITLTESSSLRMGFTESNSVTSSTSLTVPVGMDSSANAGVAIITYVTDTATVLDVTDTGTDSYTQLCTASTSLSIDATYKKVTEIWAKQDPNVNAGEIDITFSAPVVEGAASFTDFINADDTSPFLESTCEVGIGSSNEYSITDYNESNIFLLSGTQIDGTATVVENSIVNGDGAFTGLMGEELANETLTRGNFLVTANWASNQPFFDFTDPDTNENITAGVVIQAENNGDTTAPVFGTFDHAPDAVTGKDVSVAGSVTDDVAIRDWYDVTYSLDYRDAVRADIYNPSTTYRYFAFDLKNLASGSHHLDIFTQDSAGNVASHSFDFTTSITPPSFTFTKTPDDYGDLTGTLVPGGFRIEGDLTDDVGVGYTQYSYDDDTYYHDTWMTDRTATTVHFFHDVSLTTGDHEVRIKGVDNNGNATITTFNFTVDSENPVCEMPHLGKYIYEDILTYTNIHCTDNDGISSAFFFAYHGGFGTQSEGNVNPVSGAFGDGSLDFTFTTGVLIDGGYYIGFRVKDMAGNSVDFHDDLVVETIDDSNPLVFLDAITPTNTVVSKPYISGSCGDTQEFDTNSFISAMKYQIDATDEFSWIDLPSTDGTISDEYTENYAYQLPSDLSLGEHTIYVYCGDAANHNATASSTTFTVIAPDESEPPALETKTEDFSTTNNYDANRSSNVIWGNGQLRLKEDIPFTQTILDGTDNGQALVSDPDGTTLWYSYAGHVVHYRISDGAVLKDYSGDDLGNTGYVRMIKPFVYNGVTYLWISKDYNVVVLNTATDQHASITSEVSSIDPDMRAGSNGFNAWMLPNGGGEVFYLNTNGTFFDNTDDITTTYTSSDGYTGGISLHHMEGTNYTLVSAYGEPGLMKWDDNGTPGNKTDDTIIAYPTLAACFGLTDDGNGTIYYAVTFGSVGKVGVVTDNGTPMNIADDTVLDLGGAGDKLRSESPGQIHFIPGQNGMGDQLVASGFSSTLIYVNTNDTPLDKNDDTFIFWDLSENQSASVRSYDIHDYTHIYVSKTTGALERIDLSRGFKTSGNAIATSTPPVDKLYANNITLKDIVTGPTINFGGTSGINYFVSADSGDTWTEISPNEVARYDTLDYRVKVKVVLSSDGHASSVLRGYTLQFGTYSTEEQLVSKNLVIDPNKTTIQTDAGFNIAAEIVDDLAFIVSEYTGEVTLTLHDYNSPSTVVDALTVDSIDVANGVGEVLGASITQPGEYFILAETDGLSTQSDKIVVTNEEVPVPTLSFTASSYTITKGNSVSLNWSSTNLTSMSINQGIGNVDLNGSREVTPTGTTIYTISGSGTYGSLESSLTIVVNDVEDTTTQPTSTEASTGVTFLFNAEEFNVKQGEKVSLTWTITGAETITLDYLNEEVSANGSLEFYPTENINLTFTAKDANGQEYTKVIPVRVEGATNVVADPNGTDEESLTSTEQTVKDVVTTGVTATAVVAVVSTILVVAQTAVATGGLSLASLASASSSNVSGILFGTLVSKKKKYWGIVYDSSDFKPIPFAVVRVISKATGEVSEAVTDLEGRYGILLDQSGSYTIQVKSPAYNSFEITKDINITMEVIMDVALKKEGESSRNIKNLINYAWPHLYSYLNKVLIVLMLIGFIYTINAVMKTATVMNYIFLAVYGLLFLINIIRIYKKMVIKKGMIVDGNGMKLPGTLIRLYKDTEQVFVGITNTNGEIKIDLQKGDYEALVHKDGYIELKNTINIQEGGYIADNIVLERHSSEDSGPDSSDNVDSTNGLVNPFG